MQFITTSISTVGFPIFMCVLLWKQNETQDQRHAEQIKQLTEVVGNNTKMLEIVKERIDTIL